MSPFNSNKLSNYYDILEIKKNATEDEIKKAYRKRALEWHPDKQNHPKQLELAKQLKRPEAEEDLKLAKKALDEAQSEAERVTAEKKLDEAKNVFEQIQKNLKDIVEEKFKAINTANETLSDPVKRSEYDATLKPGWRGAQDETPLRKPKEAPAQTHRSNPEPFENTYQNKTKDEPRKAPARDYSDAYYSKPMPQKHTPKQTPRTYDDFYMPTPKRNWHDMNSTHKSARPEAPKPHAPKTAEKMPKQASPASEDTSSKHALNELRQQYFELLINLMLIDMMIKNSSRTHNQFSPRPFFIIIEVSQDNCFQQRNNYNPVASLFKEPWQAANQQTTVEANEYRDHSPRVIF